MEFRHRLEQFKRCFYLKILQIFSACLKIRTWTYPKHSFVFTAKLAGAFITDIVSDLGKRALFLFDALSGFGQSQ